MSRLTIDEIINHCRKTCESIEFVAIAQGKNQDDITSKQYWEHYLVGEWLNELKKYKDAEEKGLLIKLPCKVGDTVYSVTRNFISKYTIFSIEKYKEGFFFNWNCEEGIYANIRGFTEFEIGKTVFLTKEEAEQKLKEMESDTNGKN